MTKTITILAIVAAFVIGFSLQSVSAIESPKILNTGTASMFIGCPVDQIQHWVEFFVSGPDVPLKHDTEITITESFFIVLPISAFEIISNDDIKQRIVDRLNLLGYFVEDPDPRPVEISDILSQGIIAEEGFTTICAEVGLSQVIGGLLFQPDSTALFLAYGIANAIWLAPLAGIGAGIYLTRNKWKR